VGAAALGAACGPAGDIESEEPIESLELPAADYSNVPSWTWENISNCFAFARDVRWLKMDGDPNFSRRASWLYPDQGCEARAEIICYRAGLALLKKPYKAFVSGNLKVTTDNAPPGKTYVTWGYHIAPIVKSSATGNVWVLDPSVDAWMPLRIDTWLSRINGAAASVIVKDPRSWGASGTATIDRAIEEMESTWLKKEWDRQVALGRDPKKVLGDSPPWA
jgi:hypothetical protein